MVNEKADSNSGTQKLQLQCDCLLVHSSRNEGARKTSVRKTLKNLQQEFKTKGIKKKLKKKVRKKEQRKSKFKQKSKKEKITTNRF